MSDLTSKGLFNQTLFADVIVPVPIPKLFTYKIPEETQNSVAEGSRVVIRFGQRNIYTGVIAKLHHTPPSAYEARYILDVLDETPHLNEYQLSLFRWMSEYYMCTIGEVLNVALPSGLKLSSESHIELHPEFDYYESTHDFNRNEEAVIEALNREKKLTYMQVGKLLNIKNYQPVLKSLLKKGAIIIYEKVKERYIPKKEKFIRLANEYLEVEGALEELMNELEKKPKQQDVLLSYLREVPVFSDVTLNEKGLSKSALFKNDISDSSLKTLVRKNIFEEFEIVIPRIITSGTSSKREFQLTEKQEEAKQEILALFESRQTVLLHGITGSGKTEVYIEIINKVLEEGGQVLYLLPEIALTTQMVTRLFEIFGDKMGVYHSKYSDNERVEVWKGVLNGRFNLVVGVRSAIFLPFNNLNLVIVDEEHEPSYKQFDPAPRYQARDVSQVLAKIHSAKVLLGSATPSVESYFLARSGKYGLVEMTTRYGDVSLPVIKFADTRIARQQQTLKNDFSSELFEEIGATIANKEQVIIFRNRRGYSPHISCEDCAWIPKCQNCAVSLTYHMFKNVVQCHYCGYKQKLPSSCPACGSAKIKSVGFGTEKLEEDLKLFFPEATIKRMDLDTTRRKFSFNQLLDEFGKGSVDILVGTQMVTKGLDFDSVRLVGVMDADVMMHFPDFRAYERSFQMLTQVSGRAGRRKKQGLVIIQTGNVNQPVLKWMKQGDFESMYRYEIGERQKFRYPPFYRLIKIILKHKDKEICERCAVQYGNLLKSDLGREMVIDPHEPMISKIKNNFLMEIYIKAAREKIKLSRLKEIIQQAGGEITSKKEFRQVQIVYDVDPY